MTDRELAELLNLTPDEAAVFLPKLTAGRRAALESLGAVADSLNRWQAGIEPKPPGVIACGPRQIRGAGK